MEKDIKKMIKKRLEDQIMLRTALSKIDDLEWGEYDKEAEKYENKVSFMLDSKCMVKDEDGYHEEFSIHCSDVRQMAEILGCEVKTDPRNDSKYPHEYYFHYEYEGVQWRIFSIA